MVIVVFPVAYQTNDDPSIARVLQGDPAIGTDPDGRSGVILSGVGWMISSLTGLIPGVAWYGLFVASLYVFGYSIIGHGFLKGVGAATLVERLCVFAAFVWAFALLPMVLFQWSVAAGLLALAGMIPCVRLLCLREPSGALLWIASAVATILGLTVRVQLAMVVTVSFIPLLVVARFFGLGWRRVATCAVYMTAVLALGVGMFAIDRQLNKHDPAYERFLDYNSLRYRFVGRISYDLVLPTSVGTGQVDDHPPGNRGSGTDLGLPTANATLSENDYLMAALQMVFDSGPYRLENLAASLGESSTETRVVTPIRGASQSVAHSETLADRNRDSKTLKKLTSTSRNVTWRSIRLPVFLVAVIGAAIALTAASAALREWPITVHLVTIACSVAILFVLTLVVFDRPVFRVLFPCANVFLVSSLVVFPWSRLRGGPGSRSELAQPAVTAAMIGFLFMAGLGAVAGMVQVGLNRAQREVQRELARDVIGGMGDGQMTIVEWAGAGVVEYRSPFAIGTGWPAEFYAVGFSSSHPRVRASLTRRFGDDAYRGFSDPEVVHLVTSAHQIDVLEEFYSEHYGLTVEGVVHGAYDNGLGKTMQVTFVEQPGDWSFGFRDEHR
jgi:hypothetical protein